MGEVELYHPKSWWTRYVFSQDAKVIAIQYSITALSIGMVALVLSWMMRLQLVGVEALIPINRQSGTNVGVIAQLHFYLDDIAPRVIGKPIFGNAVQLANPFVKELMMRRSTLIAIIPLLLLLATGEASAHAVLDHAEPRVGNKVATAPHEVTLWFTQKLEAAFSTITVTNSAGQRVDTGKTRVSGSQMSVSLRPAGTGTYHVTWRVLSTRIRLTAVSHFKSVGRSRPTQ